MKVPASLVVSALATPALGFVSWFKTEEAPAYTPCDNGCFSEARCCPGVLEAVHPDDCFLRALLGLHLPPLLVFRLSPLYFSSPLTLSPVPRHFLSFP